MRTAGCKPALGKTGHECRTWIPGVSCVLFVCGLYIFLSAPAVAQEPQKIEPTAASQGQEDKPTPPQEVDQSQQPTAAAQPEPQPKKKKNFSIPAGIVVAPLLISSPAIGSGMTPVLGYIFPFNKHDKVSPPSTIGVAGLFTEQRQPGIRRGRTALPERKCV